MTQPNTKEEMAAICLLDDDVLVDITWIDGIHKGVTHRTTRGKILPNFPLCHYAEVVEPEPLECWRVDEKDGETWCTRSENTLTSSVRADSKVTLMTPATLDADVLREHAIAYGASIKAWAGNFTYDRWIKEQEE